MSMNEDIGKRCLRRASSLEMRRVAIGQGMITLRNDGLRKATTGATSLEEVMRILS